jgi:hypothetical protein
MGLNGGSIAEQAWAEYALATRGTPTLAKSKGDSSSTRQKPPRFRRDDRQKQSGGDQVWLDEGQSGVLRAVVLAFSFLFRNTIFRRGDENDLGKTPRDCDHRADRGVFADVLGRDETLRDAAAEQGSAGDRRFG